MFNNESTTINSREFWIRREDCSGGKYELQLFTYIKRRDDDDDVPDFWENGQHDEFSSKKRLYSNG